MPIQYASLAEVKQGNAIKVSTDDAWITALIQSAKRAIDNYCGRGEDGFRADGQPTEREFVGSGKPIQWIDECARITLVEIKTSPSDDTYVTLTSSDWIGGRGNPKRAAFGDRQFRPYQWIQTKPNGNYSVFVSGRMRGRPGFMIDPDQTDDQTTPTVRVTANWGYSMDTPPEVKEATIKQVGRWLMRGRSQQSDSTATPELGVSVFRRSYDTLDQDVAMILISGGLMRRAE